MKRRTWIAILTALLIGCLLLAGCSYPDDGEPPMTAAPRTDVPEPVSTEPAPESDAPVQTDEPVQTDAPTEPPTEDPVTLEVQDILSRLTTEEKVAQLLFVTPEALAEIIGPATVAGLTTQAAYNRYPVGGVIYMGQNLVTPAQTQELLAGMQRFADERLSIPVFLAVDEEGGSVARVSGNAAFDIGPYPNMSEIGAAGDTEEARRIGAEIGAYLKELGFNLDFAPVADVRTEPVNAVTDLRAFSGEAKVVTEMCAAFADGLQSEGVMACYKHFPGHGGTSADSHNGEAVSPRSSEELYYIDLKPFYDAVDRGIPFIMVGHITVPNVTEEDLPASLSYEFVTVLLREMMGYEGVVITDALNMGAITNEYTLGEAAVKAFLAGDDMILLSDGISTVYQALLDAVEDGTISMERLDESVSRILRTKLTQLTEE